MSRDLIFIAIALFSWGLGESAFLTFQSLYLQQLGADPIRIGAIIGGYGLAATLMHLPAGYMADRFGRRPMMWAAWILGATSTWMMAMARSLPLYVAGMLVYSTTMFVIAPMYSYVAAAAGKWSVGRVMSLVSASFNAGAILGPFLGGILGERYGYRMIYQIAAWVFIGSSIVILFIRNQPIEARQEKEKGASIIQNRAYLVFIGIYFLTMFALYLPQPLSPNFLQNENGLSLVQIGNLYSINSIGIVVLNLLFGLLSPRLGFLIGQVSVAVFSLLLWRGQGMAWYTLAYLSLGGFRAARPMAIAYIRSIVSGANMGLAFGLAETASGFALFLAPFFAGYIYDLDPMRVYIVSLGMIAVSLLLSSFFTLRPRRERSPEKNLPTQEPI